MNDTTPTSSEPAAEKPGLTLALVACGMGVLGILTPLIGSLFVLITLILTIIAFIKGVKNRYGPTIGFSALSFVLFWMGVGTSPLLLSIIGLGAIAAG